MHANLRTEIERRLSLAGIQAYAAYDKAIGTYVILTFSNISNLEEICGSIVYDIWDERCSKTEAAARRPTAGFVPPVVTDVSCFNSRIKLYYDTLSVRAKNKTNYHED